MPNNPPPQAPSTMNQCLDEVLTRLDSAHEMAWQIVILVKRAYHIVSQGEVRSLSSQRSIAYSIKILLKLAQKQILEGKDKEEEFMFLKEKVEDQQSRLVWYDETAKVKEQEKQHVMNRHPKARGGKKIKQGHRKERVNKIIVERVGGG